MVHLRESGLDTVVKEAAAGSKPLLGICLGMQLLFSSSEEHGEHEGLDILPGKVVRFAPGELKVPHMGWNRLEFLHAAYGVSEHVLIDLTMIGDFSYYTGMTFEGVLLLLRRSVCQPFVMRAID